MPLSLARRAAAGGACVAVALAGLTAIAPGAVAGPEEDKQRVDAQVQALRTALEGTSTELADAYLALQRAEGRLPEARAELEAAQRAAARAEACHAALASRLEVAQAEEVLARQEVAEGIQRADDTRATVGRIAREAYTDGGVSGVALALGAQTPEEFADRVVLVDSAMRVQNGALAKLQTQQAENRSKQARLEAVREEVLRLKSEAEENLAAARDARQRAAAVTTEIERLVAASQAAAQVVENRRAEELARLSQAEAEQAALRAELERRAREARERAEAERLARKRAEAERLARKQAERERLEEQQEQAERQQAEREQAEREQAEREQAEREQAERQQAEREQVERARTQRAERSSRPAAGPSAPARAPQRGPAPQQGPDPQRRPAEPSVSSGGALSAPTTGAITSSYGPRIHPIYGDRRMHTGTDFGSPCGTPVRAAAGGTVIRAGAAGGYGNQVVVDHGLIGGVGLASSYNHLSSVTVRGGSVSRGQVIGYVGTTGASTGCHLHFEVFEDGAVVDPMRWL